MKKIYAERREKVRSLLDQRGLDALLVSSPANRFYLSGFALHDTQLNESSGYLLICKSGQDWLLTDSRYTLAAERLWDKERIFIYSGNMLLTQQFLASQAAIIGLESKCLTLYFAQKLGSHEGKIYIPSFIPVDGIVESLRVIKDKSEIAALGKSFSLNHALMTMLEEKISHAELSSLTEKELAWQAERFFRENGAQELAFASIIASGPNTALPHAEPENLPLGSNKPLLVDAGCRVDNYCSDQTRTWWLGEKPSDEFVKTLDLVRKAQKKAMNMMRPGVACSDVFKAAWKVFEDANVSSYFNHGLGHGVGLETHEPPHLSLRSKEVLQAGMVVTVEPGLYYSQWGGVRWENTVLVHEDGISVF